MVTLSSRRRHDSSSPSEMPATRIAARNDRSLCFVARPHDRTSMMSTKRSAIPSASRHRSAWSRTLAVKTYLGTAGSIRSSMSLSSSSRPSISPIGRSCTSLRNPSIAPSRSSRSPLASRPRRAVPCSLYSR